jgi:hypothetical protein
MAKRVLNEEDYKDWVQDHTTAEVGVGNENFSK